MPDLDKFSAHAVRDHSGLLTPSRDPHAVTDKHTTAKTPESGEFSGDGVKTAKGYAGADTRGL